VGHEIKVLLNLIAWQCRFGYVMIVTKIMVFQQFVNTLKNS